MRQLLGDFLYLGPLDYSARFHSAQARTMMAVFSYLGASKSFGSLQLDVQQQVSTDSYGPTHNNDIFYVWPNEYDPSNLQGTETNAAITYTRLIADFILYGISTTTTRYLLYSAASPNYQLINGYGQLQSVSASNYQVCAFTQ